MRPLTIRLSSKRAIHTVIIVAFSDCSRAKILFFHFFIRADSNRVLIFGAPTLKARSLSQTAYFINRFFILKPA